MLLPVPGRGASRSMLRPGLSGSGACWLRSSCRRFRPGASGVGLLAAGISGPGVGGGGRSRSLVRFSGLGPRPISSVSVPGSGVPGLVPRGPSAGDFRVGRFGLRPREACQGARPEEGQRGWPREACQGARPSGIRKPGPECPAAVLLDNHTIPGSRHNATVRSDSAAVLQRSRFATYDQKSEIPDLRSP